VTVSLSQHVIVLALLSVDALARGLRVRAMVPMPLARAVGVNLCGDAAAALTPAGLGADPIRFAALQRSGAAGSAVLAAFVTEFGVGAVATVIGAAVLSGLCAGAAGEFVRRLAWLVSPPARARAVAVVALCAVAGTVVAVGFRRRLPRAMARSLGDAWTAMRHQRPSLVALVGALTLLSMAARTAILPVLAARMPGLHASILIVGSYVLLFGQTVFPTPAGAGGVELGFLAGFSGSLGRGDLSRLLLVWRFYTLALAFLAGALMLVRARWQRGARGNGHAGLGVANGGRPENCAGGTTPRGALRVRLSGAGTACSARSSS
jgi:uncharacterized membrane protein YbhN (UPF0104 family)